MSRSNSFHHTKFDPGDKGVVLREGGLSSRPISLRIQPSTQRSGPGVFFTPDRIVKNGDNVLVLDVKKKESHVFLHVVLIKSADHAIRGWLRKVHLQPLLSSSSVPSSKPQLHDKYVITNLDKVAEARHRNPARLRLKGASGEWIPLVPKLIADLRKPKPQHFINTTVTMATGELHPEGRWEFCSGNVKTKLGVAKKAIHIIDEKQFPRKFQKRGLGRPCLTCGQKIRHYRILGGSVGGYIPANPHPANGVNSPRGVSSPREANDVISPQIKRSRLFEPADEPNPDYKSSTPSEIARLEWETLLQHVSNEPCVSGAVTPATEPEDAFEEWPSMDRTEKRPENLMLMQISMPMIICEACYRYYFCGQDGVLCTSVVVHPTLRAPCIHFAFDKDHRKLFGVSTPVARPKNVSRPINYSQYFANVEASITSGSTQSYSQHFAGTDAALTATPSPFSDDSPSSRDRSYTEFFNNDPPSDSPTPRDRSYTDFFNDDPPSDSPSSRDRSYTDFFSDPASTPGSYASTDTMVPAKSKGSLRESSSTGTMVTKSLARQLSKRASGDSEKKEKKRNSLISRTFSELFVNTAPPSPLPREHQFKVHNYRMPTNCAECRSWMWGFVRKGLKCQSCGLAIHTKCKHRVMKPCTPPPSSMSKGKVNHRLKIPPHQFTFECFIKKLAGVKDSGRSDTSDDSSETSSKRSALPRSSVGRHLLPKAVSPTPPKSEDAKHRKRAQHVPKKKAGMERRVTRQWLKGVLVSRE